ncbi:DinB family protein [Chryseolinea lacunae]|uniref:DinB family protein n=1 Tax=Chryseolinea lacunae TaxID=2801331 RepID=A0ABS1KWU6_9BACT|nr:DinB family protein [Chryseolinea lacunae]MBL0743939.1 DinB family protein [Chryseolinea lacunae]
MATDSLEVWMRGPLAGIAPLLQPVAHALLQVQEEVHAVTKDFRDKDLWTKPGGVASVGFHLQHMAGVLDRLFTYARGSMLTSEQLGALKREGEASTLTVSDLLSAFDHQVERAIDQLKSTPETVLLEPRGIGRKQIPTNVLGLLFHAAEHTQRHNGQLLVTVKWMREGS